MQRRRTLFTLLLGLILLVQGYAVAAAPYIGVPDPAQAAEMAAMADLPCHAHMAKDAAQQKPSCCDSDCPNMTTCLLGHLAVMPPVPQLQPLPDTSRSSLLPPPTKQARLSSPVFRPPIPLHG